MGHRYINTDLEVQSVADLSAIEHALGSAVVCLHKSQRDGLYFASFELSRDHGDPDSCIRAFCSHIEALPPPARAAWSNCVNRTIDVGIEATSAKASQWTVSSASLESLSRVGAVLRVTQYPPGSHAA